MRTTTPEDEFERMADNLYQQRGDVIVDRTTFDEAFKDYFAENITEIGKDKKNIKLKNKVFKEIRKINPNISKDRVIVLKKQKKSIIKPERFKFQGKQETKQGVIRVVFARKIETKAGVRYIDEKGRYVSIKK